MDTQVPETLTELTDEQLSDLIADLKAEFDAKYDSDEKAPLDELSKIADAIDAVNAEQDARAAAAAEEDEKRASLADRVRGEAEDAEITEAEDAVEAVALEEETAEVAATDDVEEADTEDTSEKEEPVTAAAKPASASGVRSRKGKTTPPPADAAGAVTITAAADVPGFGSGAKISKQDILTAMHARARGLMDKSPRLGVATVDQGIDPALVITASSNGAEVIEEAVNRGLAGADAASLVASGGWCAPSETLFDEFGVESRDGLIDLPTIGISRGGVQVPSFIGIGAASAGLWTWTEANDENPGSDGPATKPCVVVPCPTWTDFRLEAEGLCVTNGNLMERAVPERTARFIDVTMSAHQHRLSNAIVADIVATAEAVTVPGVSDAAGDLLNAISLQVADFRSEHLMSENVVLEAVFPQWVKEGIRASIAMRAGVPGYEVSNAEVEAFFTSRNVRPQYLAGYEPLFDTNEATAWPATVKFLLWPSGGFVKGTGGTIDLGVVRDSTLNETNDYTAAWSEEFYVTVQRGPNAREVTAAFVVNGQTGGPKHVATAS